MPLVFPKFFPFTSKTFIPSFPVLSEAVLDALFREYLAVLLPRTVQRKETKRAMLCPHPPICWTRHDFQLFPCIRIITTGQRFEMIQDTEAARRGACRRSGKKTPGQLPEVARMLG
ncbi:hypothetical protein H920_15366 [Fukomys damarensis]|uniref:Uncharacterized protein n=1 Tax=Fukomys damarensis TaxID=885580 RepID=A0A091DKB1_FUKDA|nr:hypothetical protein H920_15366 [Fukomys damarensis]